MSEGREAIAKALYPHVMNTWEDMWPDWEYADEQQADFLRDLADVALAALATPERPEVESEDGAA